MVPKSGRTFSPLPDLKKEVAKHGYSSRPIGREFNDATGQISFHKRSDSGGIQTGVVTEWIGRYNSGTAALAQGGAALGLVPLSPGGFDIFRTGGEFYNPYVGTPGVFILDVMGNPVFMGGIPNPGAGLMVDAPANVGVNYQSEKQHNYKTGKTEEHHQTRSQRSNTPDDLLSGDWVRITPEGNYIGCYRGGLNIMGSGQWSEIITCRIDQLVRIRSKTFEHFDSLGELRSYNDEGELTKEILLTDEQSEAAGSERFGYENISKEKDSEKGELIRQLKEAGKVGRWRLQMHVGYLGDLMHLVFTKPNPDSGYQTTVPKPKDPGVNPGEQGSAASAPPVGVAELFIGSDGTVVTRSTREILSEKVGHIRVPLKKHEANDPEGDTKKDGYKRAERKPFVWNKDNPGGSHLQENEFRHWEVDHDEMYRYRGHKKDWEVKKRSDSDCPQKESGEEEYVPGISVFHQRNDGSIYLQDHWGSSIQLANGDIILAPVRDLMLQPGRDAAIITPRDTVIKAKKFVDITSSDKDIRLAASRALYMYTKYSGILMETESSKSVTPPTDSDPEYNEPVKGAKIGANNCTYSYSSGAPSTDCSDQNANRFAGIRMHLRAKQASIELHADKEDCPVIVETEKKGSPVILRTKGDAAGISLDAQNETAPVAISAGYSLSLRSKQKDIVIRARGHIFNDCQDTFGVNASRNIEMAAKAQAHIKATNETTILQHLHEPTSIQNPLTRLTDIADTTIPHRHRVNLRHTHQMLSNPQLPTAEADDPDQTAMLGKEFKFDFRDDYCIGKKIYLTYWQFVKASSKKWKQKTDGEVKENLYPGKDFKYTTYKEAGGVSIGTDPKDDKYTPGNFEDESAEYLMVDIGKEYDEEKASGASSGSSGSSGSSSPAPAGASSSGVPANSSAAAQAAAGNPQDE